MTGPHTIDRSGRRKRNTDKNFRITQPCPDASTLRLSVAVEVQRVVALPDGTAAATLGLVVQVTLAVAAVLLAGGGETTQLTMLVHGLGDPVDTRITADGLVGGVHEDDLVELVGGVLGNPVRVEDTQATALAANTLLGDSLVAALVLERVDTMSLGLAVGLTLHHGALAATTLHAHAINDVALLGL